MTKPLIWLHEEALRANHLVFSKAPPGTKAIFIWDDFYLQTLNYSFKRLVFLYESLCELPVEIILGDTTSIIRELRPSRLYVPASNKPHLVSIFSTLKASVDVEIISEEEFVSLPRTNDFRRFFKYWSLAEKSASLKNGRLDP